MNMLVDGEWRTGAYEYTDESGEFDRQESSFRDWLDGGVAAAGEEPVSSTFTPESGRYHLYICRACPWAHRAAMVRRLRGLTDEISVSLVQPERYDQGWEFSDDHPDPLHGYDYLREVYTDADPGYTGRVTVPALWDKQTETIVNNESSEIMRMLDTAFDGNDASLYPEDRREAIDEIVDAIYGPINNGVYRAGFAGTQGAYEDAVDDLFDALDHWDAVLADQRYLAGDGERLTLADVAMFATLIRFDHVYHTHFKCNRRAIHEYPNLWGYTKDLYQTRGIAETVNMDHITRHYYGSHADINPKRIVATGPDIDFDESHGRDGLSGEPPLPQ
ncbi:MULTISPECIES: glutathione S-transferase family protein [Halolamina]|uniref:Putative glutathione S-transferase n=1 Tax=Halolamina pelagica TaxID=699431 RepID=A0A1I5RRI3_9EURY|nr:MULTISPECIES: glutathione S-transferase family protein [Halolamina]NHX35307.1 glutathione S-transferase family protein [Halolamina sp. R1-12]SFP61103.1 putative glutathione S-transferase [Halolamina pelagica]